MEDLLKAIQIFLKYGNPPFPSWCEHDSFNIDINPALVSKEDRKELDDLGFEVSDDEDGFSSTKFGSC